MLSFGELSLDPVQLSVREEDSGLRFLSERLSLAELENKLLSLEGIPESLRQSLEALSPQGYLSSASIIFSEDNQNNLHWLVEGNLDSISAQSFRGAPKVENLSGYFLVDSMGGEILIDSSNTNLHFDSLFTEAIFNEELRGQVGWRIDADAGTLDIYSGPLSSINQGAQGVAQFHMLTALSRGAFPSEFTLIAGLSGGSADRWPQYLPQLGKGSLWNWFDRSEVQGDLLETGFIYRGGFGAAQQKTYQLIGDVQNGNLKFASGWPNIEDMAGRLWLSDTDFYLLSDQASLVIWT